MALVLSSLASVLSLLSCSTPANLNLSGPAGTVLSVTAPAGPQLPSGVVGRAYGLVFAATGGSGHLTWSNPGRTLADHPHSRV